MQLTLYTDYSLRVLLFLAMKERSTVTEIAECYGISRNHLVKVVHNLSGLGYLDTFRGKGGGIKLAQPANEINIGEVVGKTEGRLDLVECFNPESNTCPIAPVCKLKSVIDEAIDKFVEVLGAYTLEDMVTNKKELVKFFPHAEFSELEKKSA